MRLFDRCGRRGNVAAALPSENEYQGDEGPRVQTFGRGDLQRQQILTQGRHRDLRSRMYGRDRFGRRPAVYQPPLRLRFDSGAVVRRTRLPEKRFLGHVARRGDPGSGTQGAFYPQDFGRHFRYSGICARRGFGRRAGAHRGRTCCGRAQPHCSGQSRHGGAGEGFLRRKPVFRLRDRGFQRRASGGNSPHFDRQVRRRHRQLDVAASYGRFLGLSRLCRTRQQAGRLRARKPPLQGRQVSEGFGGRIPSRIYS